jgi:hypothetical protein
MQSDIDAVPTSMMMTKEDDTPDSDVESGATNATDAVAGPSIPENGEFGENEEHREDEEDEEAEEYEEDEEEDEEYFGSDMSMDESRFRYARALGHRRWLS